MKFTPYFSTLQHRFLWKVKMDLWFASYYKTPLNLAHLKRKQAETCLAQNQFEEALNLHGEAVIALRDLSNQNFNATHARPENIRLSLQLQMRYHENQKQVIAIKKKQYEQKQLLNAKLQKTILENNSSPTKDSENINQMSIASLTSIDSIDSTDYLSAPPVGMTSLLTNSNYDLDQANSKEMIKRLLVHVRQQQNEILNMSKKMMEKEKENQALRKRIVELEGSFLPEE